MNSHNSQLVWASSVWTGLRRRCSSWLWLFFFGCSICLACGHAANTGGSDAPVTNTPGQLALSSANVTGTFVLGAAAAPASNYDLWIFDHTTPNLDTVPLDDFGTLRVPLQHFSVGHTYSMHLLKDSYWLGDFDLAGATPGVQPAFVYQGGLGFDLGTVQLSVDSYGTAAVQNAGIAATIGGGFSLAPATRATFSDYLLPGHVTSVAFSSQLFVFDAAALLYSFYGKADHPVAYARDLKRFYRLGGLVMARDETAVIGVRLTQAGQWQKAARLPSDDLAEPEASGLLGRLPQDLIKVSPSRYEYSVYSGGMPAATAVAVVTVQPDGGAEVDVPRRIGRLLSMPPKVTAVATSGGTPVAVDYTIASSANGLTSPICRTGEVVVDIQPPLDAAGSAVDASVFDRIEVVFDYFRDGDQRTAKIIVDSGSFAAPYAAALTDNSLVGLRRDWDPTKQMLTFTLGATAQALGSQELRIWPELFVATSAGKAANAVRLRIYYRSDAEATAAASAIWFKSGC